MKDSTMRSLILILTLLAAMCFSNISAAQPSTSETAATPANEQMTPAGGDSGASPFDFKRILTRFEFWLSLLILSFGALVVAAQFALLRKTAFDANDLLKVFGVTLIVVGTLFLIAAGFGDKQIAPAMGLFGTLAGYLLGRTSPRSAEEVSEKPSPDSEKIQ